MSTITYSSKTFIDLNSAELTENMQIKLSVFSDRTGGLVNMWNLLNLISDHPPPPPPTYFGKN